MLFNRKLLLHRSVFFACFGFFTLITLLPVYGQKGDPKDPAPAAAASPATPAAKPPDTPIILGNSEPRYVGPLQFPINDYRGDFLSNGGRSN